MSTEAFFDNRKQITERKIREPRGQKTKVANSIETPCMGLTGWFLSRGGLMVVNEPWVVAHVAHR